MKVLIWSAGSQPYSAAPPLYRAAKKAELDVDIAGNRNNAGAQAPIETLMRKDKKYDWVFSFVTLPRYNWTYDLIRKNGTKLLLWYADMMDSRRLNFWQRIAGHFDIVVCSSLATAYALKSIGAPTVFMPQYFELAETEPLPPRLNPAEPIHDICFIGQLDKHRMDLITRLKKNFDVVVHGPRESANAVFGNDMAKVYAQSKIGISFSRGAYVAPTGLFQTSNRIYRIMGSGCFLLDDERSCLHHLFKAGTHYATFDGSADGLVDRIHSWLHDENDREAIALAGQKEVLAKHTLEIRIHEYWALMEEMNNGK